MLDHLIHGVKFWPKIDCESEAKANFFSNQKAKRSESENRNFFCEAKRSEFASLRHFSQSCENCEFFFSISISENLRIFFKSSCHCSFQGHLTNFHSMSKLGKVLKSEFFFRIVNLDNFSSDTLKQHNNSLKMKTFNDAENKKFSCSFFKFLNL